MKKKTNHYSASLVVDKPLTKYTKNVTAKTIYLSSVTPAVTLKSAYFLRNIDIFRKRYHVTALPGKKSFCNSENGGGAGGAHRATSFFAESGIKFKMAGNVTPGVKAAYFLRNNAFLALPLPGTSENRGLVQRTPRHLAKVHFFLFFVCQRWLKTFDKTTQGRAK